MTSFSWFKSKPNPPRKRREIEGITRKLEEPDDGRKLLPAPTVAPHRSDDGAQLILDYHLGITQEVANVATKQAHSYQREVDDLRRETDARIAYLLDRKREQEKIAEAYSSASSYLAEDIASTQNAADEIASKVEKEVAAEIETLPANFLDTKPE